MDRNKQPSLLISSTTLKSLVDLLRERNSKYDNLKEQHEHLKGRYKSVKQERLHLEFSLLCENCRRQPCYACAEQ